MPDAVARAPKLEIFENSHNTMFQKPVGAFVDLAERCQSCWGHSGLQGAHFGHTNTLDKLRTRYTWNTMSHDRGKVLKTCAQCWRNMHPSRCKALPLHKIPKGWIGEIVAIDF